jgi:hypothetical protein
MSKSVFMCLNNILLVLDCDAVPRCTQRWLDLSLCVNLYVPLILVLFTIRPRGLLLDIDCQHKFVIKQNRITYHAFLVDNASGIHNDAMEGKRFRQRY